MSERMKKPSTSKENTEDAVFPKLSFDFGEYTQVYLNVPKVCLRPIQAYMNKTLAEYRENSDQTPFEETFSNLLNQEGGIDAYQLSAFSVRSCRNDANMTQLELANLLGIDQPYISNIERARKPVGKRLATKLSKIFTQFNASFFMSDLPD